MRDAGFFNKAASLLIRLGEDISSEKAALKHDMPIAPKGMREYMVIGVYEDNLQRWAQSFVADSPEDAESKAQDAVSRCGSHLIIAAVMDGSEVVA
jgi:hypothetical protein